MMKKLNALFLTFLFTIPMPVMASTTGGSFGYNLQIVSIGQQIVNFLSGPIARIIIILGIIAGGFMIMFAREQDNSGYRRLGLVVVGGSLMLGAVGVYQQFFGGAII